MEITDTRANYDNQLTGTRRRAKWQIVSSVASSIIRHTTKPVLLFHTTTSQKQSRLHKTVICMHNVNCPFMTQINPRSLCIFTRQNLDHTGTQNSAHNTDNANNHTKAHFGPQSPARGVAGSRGGRSGSGRRVSSRGSSRVGGCSGSSSGSSAGSGRGSSSREVAGKGRRVNSASGRYLFINSVSHRLGEQFTEEG